MLIVFRVLQGLGGGMLMPLGMTIMTRAAGPQRMGRLMAILGVPMLLGPILGPILGGWLIEDASWHWIFLINVPIGVVALVYALRVLPKDAPEPSESFDFLGMLLMSPGLALFLFGVSLDPRRGHGQLAQGAGSRCCIGLAADGRLRLPLRSGPSTRCWTCGCSRNRNLSVAIDHDVPVRRRVLRRPAAGPDLLPAGAWRVDRCTPVCWSRRRASARC